MLGAHDGDIRLCDRGNKPPKGTNLSLETPQAIPAQQVCWAKTASFACRSPGCICLCVGAGRAGRHPLQEHCSSLPTTTSHAILVNSEREPASQAFLIVKTLALYRVLSRSRTRNLHSAGISSVSSGPGSLTPVTLLRPRECCVRLLLLLRTVLPIYLASTVPTSHDVSISEYPRLALLGPR